MLRRLCACACVTLVAGHAVLTLPAARLGTGAPGQGTKLTPASNAKKDADRGCGGTDNNDPGIIQPTSVFINGSIIGVRWDLTIPHDLDNTDIGVRIAIHYKEGDSFEKNVILGCLEGETQCENRNNRVSAADLSRLVTLPADKECVHCVLQFVWQAKNDGGYYLQCADISIQSSGLLPDFANLPTEVDTNNNGLPDGVAGNNGVNPLEDERGSAVNVTVIVIVIVALLVLAGLGYLCYKKRGSLSISMPKRSGTSASGGGGGLPPGWTSTVDPSSGRTYYTDTKTGQTQWEPPAKSTAMAPMPPPSVMAPALPPGWQSAVDPSSGRTYYVNTVTGATSWDVPSQNF